MSDTPSPSVLDTCGFCPRLCRHVCPVSAATARESATPTAIVSVVRLAQAGVLAPELAEAALDLCNGCGACSRYCALHLDVAAFVRECRPAPGLPALPELPPLADAPEVVVEVADSAGDVPAPHGRTVYSRDALGHALWAAGDAHVLRRLVEHFAGRSVSTASFAIAQVLEAAGVPFTLRPPPSGSFTFKTCWEGADGVDGQIACCGAREGFESRNPATADAMAAEVTRRMGGLPHTCADGHCAAWLRAHGADVRGPHADEPG